MQARHAMPATILYSQGIRMHLTPLPLPLPAATGCGSALAQTPRCAGLA